MSMRSYETPIHGRDVSVSDICHLVSGTDEHLSLVKLEGRLGNGREFSFPKRDDTGSWVT